MGSDQGWEVNEWEVNDREARCFKPSFISFKNINNTIDILLDTIGTNNIHILKIDSEPTFKTENEELEYIEYQNNYLLDFLKNNPDKIFMRIYPDTIFIYFRCKFIPQLHKILKIKMPNSDNKIPGGLINKLHIKMDTKN